MSHEWAIAQDQRRAAAIPEAERCKRCEGTGNEFYAMYRRCSDCNGSGRVPSTEPKEAPDGHEE